jgi:hypothetical protein
MKIQYILMLVSVSILSILIVAPSFAGTLIYSTYMGGTVGDIGASIAIDNAGNAYITGWTSSADFPTTPGVVQPDWYLNAYQAEDVFVCKLDPSGTSLIYSTFLGGEFRDFGYAIAVDGSGNAYITGRTGSGLFPTTTGAFDTTKKGNFACFVSKLNPTGSALVYSTYLGGAGGSSEAVDIAIDNAGNAYITGDTNSSEFPTTPGAFDTSFNGPNYNADGFVTKLNPTGTALVYSTFLGGTNDDVCNNIALDNSDNIYITGYTVSTDFPATPGAFSTALHTKYDGTGHDAFVAKLNPSGTGLVYATYLGDIGVDVGNSIAVDDSGDAYVTGYTSSTEFPVTPGAFDTSFNGGNVTVFVTKLNNIGSALSYSTFLGGNYGEYGYTIAVDALGNAYVGGLTGSSDFPTTIGAYDTSYNGATPPTGNCFISKLNPAGSALVYSTYFGGYDGSICKSIAIDSFNNVYFTGAANADFPITPGAFDTTYNNNGDAFVAKLSLTPAAAVQDWMLYEK